MGADRLLAAAAGRVLLTTDGRILHYGTRPGSPEAIGNGCEKAPIVDCDRPGDREYRCRVFPREPPGNGTCT
jgi:hypothetical protein